jgi:hypothetical protein
MGRCRERRDLLVAGLEELDLGDFVEGEVQTVGAVTGIAVDLAHAPGMQAAQDERRDILVSHEASSERW